MKPVFASAAFCLGLLLPMTAASAGDEPVRFCITADNKGRSGFVGVAEAIHDLPGGPGRFMVSVGDFRPPDKTREQLDRVFGASFVWYPVVGNHEALHKDNRDSEEAMAYLRDYFDRHIKPIARPGPGGCEKTTYSFDAGPVHIAVINEYWDGKARPDSDGKLDGNVVGPLRRWLAADLESTDRPWKLVVGHEPAYPQEDKDWDSDRHATSSLNKYRENRDAFWKVLEDNAVAAYLCGHTHRYSRFRPPGSRVWQIDAAQARGSLTSWKYDAFLIVAADRRELKFDAYRSLRRRLRFDLTDSLTLKASAPATQPAPRASGAAP